MAPSEHIEWFEDNVRWYEGLALDQFTHRVPACPDWVVQDVLNHLSFGLGIAYPAAMTKPPHTAAEQAFDDVSWPSEYPSGQAAKDAFSENMGACAEQFRTLDAATKCWTYAGPGTAAFWFRRAAIETSLHRIDIAEALGTTPHHLDDAQAADAIAETLSFALPFASELTDVPDGQIIVDSSCLSSPVTVGTGERQATITGEPHDVLNALWGRHPDRVQLGGDHSVAVHYLVLIERAFS